MVNQPITFNAMITALIPPSLIHSARVKPFLMGLPGFDQQELFFDPTVRIAPV